MVESHLEGLGALFGKGRKITLAMEFVFKESTGEPATAKGKKKKTSATDAQRAQRAADASLWARVYKHHRCRGKHCKQGPHCWSDKRGNHHKLLPRHLEALIHHLKGNIERGKDNEDIDISIKLLPKIIEEVLNNSRK